MTDKSNSIEFKQFVSVPFMGEAWVERHAIRRSWLPHLLLRFRKDGEIQTKEGEIIPGSGPIVGYDFQAGRWEIATDRMRRGNTHTPAVRVAWNQTAWLVLAAPTLLVLGVASCLVTGLFKHFIAKPLGWLDDPTGVLPEA